MNKQIRQMWNVGTNCATSYVVVTAKYDNDQKVNIFEATTYTSQSEALEAMMRWSAVEMFEVSITSKLHQTNSDHMKKNPHELLWRDQLADLSPVGEA